MEGRAAVAYGAAMAVASSLTTEAEMFWSAGACCLRGTVPDDDVATIAAAIDSLAGSAELADLSALAGADEVARFTGGVDHWRRHEVLAELATSGAIPRAVATVLRTKRLWLYEDSVLVKEAGSTVATKWHTDDGYFHVEGTQMATVWLPVDPAPRAAGALVYRRGSHLSERRYRPTLFVTDDAIPGTAGDLPPSDGLEGPDVFGWDLDPGDMALHHARTLHAASGNSTASARRAWSIRYCGLDAVVRVKPGAPSKPGFDSVPDGTPIAEVAAELGLREAQL